MKKVLGIIILIFFLQSNTYAETEFISKISYKPIKEKRILFKKEDVLVAKYYVNYLSYNVTIDLSKLAGYCKKRDNKYFLTTKNSLSHLNKKGYRTYYCIKNEIEFFSNISKYKALTPPEYFDWNDNSKISVTNLDNLKFVSLNEYFAEQNKEQDKKDQIMFTIKDKREQCEAIGFKPETEKFADCVLRLVELDVKQQTQNQIAIAQNNGNDALVKQLQRQNNLQSSQALIDLGQQLMNPKRYNSNIYMPQTQRCTMQGFGTFATMRCR